MTVWPNSWLILLLLLLLLGVPLTAIAQPADYIPAPEVPLVYSLTPIGPEQYTPPSNTVLCNCWLGLKSFHLNNLPSTKFILSNLQSEVGRVAVFYYPETGVYHYAMVTSYSKSSFVIDETNYKHCQRTVRELTYTYKNLVGFFDKM